MENLKMAVVGLGATGSVVASALLSTYPETFIVGRKAEPGKMPAMSGLRVRGVLDYQCEVKNYIGGCAGLTGLHPDIIFVCTKTFHLPQIVAELKEIYVPGMKIVAAQNGLGPEDFLASEFGAADVWRMSLNLGAARKAPGMVETSFFNRPNHLGCMSEKDQASGKQIARIMTDCGLDTEFVEDINRYVWRKMVMKCTMSAVCAVTDLTFREALEFKPTREIADACIAEALSVARSLGYEFEEGYARQAIDYLLEAGSHKDSMCQDIADKLPTEIDFLGAKVVEYGRTNGVPTPHFRTMTNLVKTIEARYLAR